MYYDYNGKKIFYRDMSKGDVIVLLPGNTASSAAHINEIDYFSKNYRVICPDYIGYGQSERTNKLPDNFWYESALMILGLMKDLNVDKYKIIGSSGGGLIGLNMAIIAPEKTELIVADSLIGEYIDESISSKIIKSRAHTDKRIQEFWRYTHGEDWEKVIEFDSNMIGQFSKRGKSIFNGNLNKIKCPVLLIGSLNDELVPDIQSNMGKICKQIKNAKLLLYSYGRHPVMWTNSDVYRKDVMDFLTRY